MTRTPTGPNTDVDYTPDTTSNGYQEFNLYVPDSTVFTAPGAGWPVVVWINNAAYTASTRGATISGVRERIVDNGMVLVDATVTITDTVDVNIDGGGMFWPPTAAEWATDDVPNHDVLWIIQYLRDNASGLAIDPDAIALYGPTNAAGTLALWAALQDDLADSGSGTPMLTESTLPDVVAAVDATTWFIAMDETVAQDYLRDSVDDQIPAATYGDSLDAHRRSGSPLGRWGAGRDVPIPVLLRYTGAAESADLSLSGTDPYRPVLTDTIVDPADFWHGLVAMKTMRDRVGPGVFHSNKSRLSHDSHTAGGDENPDDFDERLIVFLRQALGTASGVETWDVPFRWAVPIDSSHVGVMDPGVHHHRRRTQNSTPSHGGIRQWRIGHDQVWDADVTRLLAIKNAASGQTRTIIFTPPDEAGAVEVRLGADLQIVHDAHGHYRYEATLVENA